MVSNDPASTAVSGLSHLEGEDVAILADGASHPSKTVASGAITLDYEASKAVVGIPFTSEMQTMPFDLGAQDGSTMGRLKRIPEVLVRLRNTLDAEVSDSPDGTFHAVVTRRLGTPGDSLDATPALFTGDVQLAMPQGHARQVTVCLRSTGAQPLSVLAVVPQLDLTER